MFPSEMLILMASAAARDSSKKLLANRMDVVGEYIGYLYDSLVKRGYLKRSSSGEYQLTPMGKEVFFEFLHYNRTRARDMIGRLQQLGIEASHEIDILKEGTEVKLEK